MIKYGRTIKSVSYLNGNKRERLQVSPSGKFPIGLDLYVYPNDLIEINGIKQNDPALTLVDGDKVRVFYGGSPDQILVQASGIIDNHVTYYKDSGKEKPCPDSDQFDWREWSNYFGYTRGSD